jgi:PAS domain S-box-containing protein
LTENTSQFHHSEERFRLLVEAIEDYAIFLLDRNGIVTSWNAGAQKINGYTAAEIVGQPFTRFYPQAAIDARWPQRELELASRLGRFEDEGWRLRKDGTRFWANVVITALHGAGGEVDGFAKITRDLSERRAHEEALRQSEERFRLLLESVTDAAIYMLDVDGRVQSWNGGAHAIKGYDSGDVLGRHFSIFFTADDAASGRPARLLAGARERGRADDEGWLVRKDGSVFWAAVSLTAVYDAEHRLRGFAQVTRDMSERRRLAELEGSTRRMSEFLAMLAHELRNPLAPIRNAISLMQIEAIESPRLRMTRDIIDRQLRQLTRLVDDLLDVGRITTGKISLQRHPIDLRDVVLRGVEAVRPLIEARDHRLDVDLPAQPIELTGDDARLTQVLQNLLVNAAKYTDPGGRIAVAARAETATAVITVTDTGRGISPQALERVFELFVQEASNTEPTDSGLGIGLTLARRLIELHGGTIRAESAGPGQGSRFTVRLPLACGGERHDEAPVMAEPPPPVGRRVLVVDDNRDSADTMAALVRALGHEARATYDGPTAVKVAQAFHPELVLLDLNLPGDSGFAVKQQMQAMELPPRRIVAMTGYGRTVDRERTTAAGFDDHLTKPVDVAQLQTLLAQIASPFDASPP